MAKRYLALLRFVKDPIHGEIDIPTEFSVIDDLLNTREMRRLNRVHQLGESFNVFPCAVHTRFSHSLGVYNNAKKFIETLEQEIDIPLADKKVILCAALLHDVGHGPRSHCFENLTKHNHEEMTNKIISDPNSEVHAALNKHRVNHKEVCSIINHTHKHKFYSQIVSSQIDSDRMDYLLRDSYFTGAPYGNIDSGIIFKRVSVVNDELVFDEKAMDAIEDMLFSRMQMSKQVYFNKKVICYELLLNKIFKRYKDLHETGFKFKDKCGLYCLLNPFLENKKWDLDLFVELDDDSLDLIIRCWNQEDDEILKKLTDNYLFKNNFICKNVRKIRKKKSRKSKSYFYERYKTEFIIYKNDEPIMIKKDNKIVKLTSINKTLFFKKGNHFKYLLDFYEKK